MKNTKISTKNIKLSIITVCKNEEKRIKKTLTSVKNQTYKNIEHLVIDGQSTDNTISIIEQYQPDYFISKLDTGIYQAMNKGIAAATGDILLFLNAGDYLADDGIVELAIKTFDDDTDILFGRVFIFNETDKKLTKNIKISWKFFLLGTIPHPASFIKKKLFNDIGMYNEQLKIAADRDFFVKAFLKNKVFKQINIPISYFESGGLSAIEHDICHLENYIILKDNFFNKYIREFEEEFRFMAGLTKQKMPLKRINNFYLTVEDKKNTSIVFQKSIRNNIALISYHFEIIHPRLLLYYLRYKLKYFFATNSLNLHFQRHDGMNSSR